MKKLSAILIILAICVCCFCAAAENEPVITDLPVAGLRMTWPRAFTETKGTVTADGVYALDNGIYYAYWYYCAAEPEEAKRLIEANQYASISDIIFLTFSVAENREIQEVAETLNRQGLHLSADDLVPLGETETWDFYLYMAYNPDFGEAVSREYADEYASLCAMKDEIASAFTLSVPFNEYGSMDGCEIRFTGTDLDGNPVTSEELFGQHAVTMVNLWATWCGPCVNELPELQAIHTRIQEKDCAVVGLMIDDDVEKARKLLSQNGITYPIVIVPAEFSMVFPFEAIPTTFFTDRGGSFLGTKFTGAYPDMYEDALDALLNQ